MTILYIALAVCACVLLAFLLAFMNVLFDRRAKRYWIILWWGTPHWEKFEGSEEEARAFATARHHSYGRTGYSLIGLDRPIENEDPK